MPSRGIPFSSLLALDLDTIRVIRTGFVQSQYVRCHQADQHERESNHVEREETVQRCITDDEVTADDQ
jgi:hypothetical protein